MSKTQTSAGTAKDSSSMQAFVSRILDRLSASALLSRRGAARRRNREASAAEALETRALLAGVYESTVMADSPTAYWRLGEPNSATTIADISGNGLSGTRVGGTFEQAGALANDPNTAALLSSSGTGAVVNDTNALTPGAAATFEAWIKPNAASTGNYQNIISKRHPALGPIEYTFVLSPGGRLHFNATNSVGGWSILESSVIVSPGQWQHVAATVQSGIVRLYINGAQVGSGVAAGNFQNTNTPVVIGFSHFEYDNFQFRGQIDEVAFYQTALPQSRLLAHYQAGTNFLPTNISLSSQSVAENQAAGTSVGNLSTTDTSGNTHTYSLVSGTGDSDNASFEVVGNQLRTKSPFDFETKSSYTVRVRTTDQGQLTFEKAFTINVTDRDEIPPAVTSTSFLTTGALTANSTSLSVTFSEPVAFQNAIAANPLGSATNPAYSAKHILTENPSVSSGIYWIDPNGGSPSDAFQVYCDMSTDGGGWMLAVNSVLGSEAASNLINSNTGTVGLSTGHTRNLDYIATSQTAQIRHYIDARNVGRDVFHGKYTGTYTTMSSYEQMTRLPDSINSPYLLAQQFGRSLSSTPYGSNWYYPGAFSSIPATPSNGSSGPAFDNNPANLINAYRIWVREAGSSGNGASSIPAIPASGAVNPANYELRRAGADGLLGNADDPIVNLTSIAVNGNTATLGFSALSDDVYRLTVKDSIADGAANLLDGDNNSIAGGNWRKDFVVGALSTSLTSSNGSTFDPEFGGVGAAQLVQGPGNAFDGTNRLEVAGTAFSASPNPTVNISESFVNVPQVQISSGFANLSGLSTTITTSGTNPVRLSSAFNLYVSPSSNWANVEVRFVVDGTPLPVAATVLTPQTSSGSAPQVVPVFVEDYVTLAAGLRSITIQARQINDPGAGGAPSSFPIFVDDGATASIRAIEFLAAGSIAESFANVPKAQVSSSFANLNGLSTTITTSGTNPARLSSAFNLFLFPTSSWANVEVRFVVDGTPLPVAATFLTPQLSSGSSPQVIPVVVEDYVTLAAGLRTITIQARQINDPAAGGAPSSFPIFFDSGPASSIRAIEYDSVGSVSEAFANVPQAQIASSFAALSGLSTTIATNGSNPVRLSSSFNLYSAPSSNWANVEVRFVVDGTPLPVAATILTPQLSSGNPQVIPVVVEDYVTLAAGLRTITIQARQINDPAAGGSPSSFQIFVDDGAAASVRAIEFLAQPLSTDGGRTIATNSQTISGVDVRREVTVPSVGTGDFSRTVDTFTNATGAAISLPVRTVGNLGSDAATTVFATSDGDLIVETTDVWFGTDDGDGTGTPAIIHMLHGPFGLQPTSVNVIDDNVEWTYALTVPAGETKRLASFTVLGTTRAEAIAAANALVTNTGFGGEAAAFLTSGELASLANFEFNTAPTDVSLSSNSIAENRPAESTVGGFSTVDANLADSFTYTLVSGTGDADNSQFSINGNSLRTTASFDFEAKSSYSIRVRATDLGGLSFEKTLTISVTNVADSPPTSLSLSNSSVSASALPGTSIGTFTTVDPDLGSTFILSLVSGTGDNDNSRFQVFGNVLLTNSAFDYGLQKTFSIRVRTTDQTGLSFEDSLNITLLRGVATVVEDLLPGGGISSIGNSSTPSSMIDVSGTTYFVANNATNGNELWRINSSGVAELVEDAVAGGGIYPGSGSSGPGDLTNVNGTLYFRASGDLIGHELWRINSSGVAEIVEDSVAGGGIRPASNSSSPSNLTNVNGALYFTANDGSSGTELWRINSSGVAELVEDAMAGGGINPGVNSSGPGTLTNVNGTLYFTANDGSSGAELWRINSSGVAEMVDDALVGGGIRPGSSGSTSSNLTNVNGTLYFGANDGANGTELWRINSSGVAEMVEDALAGGGINPGVSSSLPASLTNVNGTLYFRATDVLSGQELWRINSSGIAELVEDAVAGGGIRPGNGNSGPSNLTNVDGTLFFSAFDGLNGTELWGINSSGVAELVEDAVAGGGINPGFTSSTPGNLTNVDGTLYFNANDGVNGYELWRINGSGVAELVEDAVPGGGINSGSSSSSPQLLTNVNGSVYFIANDGVNGQELWRISSSGVAELVEDAVPAGGINSGSGSSSPQLLTNVNGTLYLSANDFVNGIELWRINSSGVAEMLEVAVAGGGINPGNKSSATQSLTNVSGTLYFRANDGVNGYELWRINSSGVAELVEDAVPGGGISTGSNGSFPADLTNVNGTLYFRGVNSVNGDELWRINSSGVAEIVEDSVAGGGINPGSYDSNPGNLANINGTLYFSASDGVNGTELWRINSLGIAEMVEDAVPGGGINAGSKGSFPTNLTNVNETIYFRALDEVNGTELWRINSSGVAEMVEDAVVVGGINPGSSSSSPFYLTNVNGTLYFRAFDGVNGQELWRLNSSGVAEMVEDAVAGGGINPGSSTSAPTKLTNINGTLYFSASDGVSGTELWRINSAGAAEMVEDAVAGGGINVGSSGSNPYFLTNVNGTLYFRASDAVNGIELWRIDSSGAAEMVEDAVAGGGISPGSYSAVPGYLTNVNGTLYFAANDNVNGGELWRINSSGVAEMVEDAVAGGGIRPGSSGSAGSLTNVNGTLYFSANDGVNGPELWRINSLGLAQIVDDAVAGGGINPGTGSSNPSQLIAIGNNLYFVADDGFANGQELWVLTLNSAPTDLSLSSQMLAENAGSDAVVGTLSFSDPDPGDTGGFSLPSGFGDNAVFNIAPDGITLRANAGFDFEVKNSYSIIVRVTDADGLSFDKQFTITVSDVAEDATAPVTLITALPAASASQTLNIAVTGIDPGAGASGVLEFDLYVSSGGAFTKFATVPAASPTTTFTGSANTTYWFRSLGRDVAGNVETKTTSDTFTRIGDVVPPSTNVTSAVPTSNGLFTVQMTGTKISGTPLTVFDVYVSIDGNTPLLAGTTSSLALGGGNYSGEILIQGPLDSTSHTYRFFSRGRDSAGNVEPAPASGDVSVTYSFASAPLTATAIDVQNGVNQRSYVRYLDVLFSSSTGLSNLLSTDHVKVERYGIDATMLAPGMGTQVNGFTLSQQGNRLRMDFGANGLGGLRQAGNGFYRVYLDLDLTAAFNDIPDRSFEFHRLFGDATGDGKVDVADTNLVTSQIGRTGLNLDGDLDGNGSVNSTDRLFTTQQRGKKLLDDMLGFLDD